MGQIKYDVEALFVEPVFRADIGAAITPKQVEFVKSLKMIPNQTNLISENLNIFDEPELENIKRAVQMVLDIYADKVMGIEQKLYVTQSWALINKPGAGMHAHSHSNSVISGSLYFTDMPEPAASMIFDRSTGYRQLRLDPAMEKRSLYNTPVNIVVPKKNEVLLFSSRLTHLVQPNESNELRYSIAFNTFVKGTIGDLRDVSLLTV
jgi:uncharacterized protein (TIGR02466 family)